MLARPGVYRAEVTYELEDGGQAGFSSVTTGEPEPDDQSVRFEVYRRYFYHDGIEKGYVFSTTSPFGQEVRTLDGRTRAEGAAFRRIDEDWYLYFTPL